MHRGQIARVASGISMARTMRALTTSTKFAFTDIPVCKGLPFVGNFIALQRAGGAPHLHRYIDQRHRVYGPLFKEKLAPNVHAVFISDPEVMRAVFAKEGKHPMHALPEAWTVYNELYGCARGLFFMNGPEWLHHRRAMNGLLMKTTPSRSIQEAVEESAGHFSVQNWEDNLEDALYRWSLDTIVAVMLGKERYLQCRHDVDPRIDDVARKIKLIFETSAKLQLAPVRLARRLGLRVWKDFVRAVDDALADVSDLVHDLIKYAHATGVEASSNEMGVIASMRKAQTAPSDIIKIVVDLVLAAGDTTAYTMQWALYSLARNPKYQNAHTPTDIRNIVRETLRLYPVAPFLTRINTEADIIAGSYYIPKNTLLIYSLYTVGRDARIFEQPDRFRPERWLEKTPSMVQASLPFAMGARSCIGRRIAELQLSTALRNVLTEYSIQLRQPNVDIDLILKMISVPSKPVELMFTRKYSNAIGTRD